MNIPELPDESLKLLHQNMRERLEEDDRTLAGRRKPWGIRSHPDFRKQSGEFEAEFNRRGMPYAKIL
jgi:hypothetical protein